MKFRIVSNSTGSSLYWLWLEYNHPGRKAPNTLSIDELSTTNYDVLQAWIKKCKTIALANGLEIVDEIDYSRMQCVVSLDRVVGA